MTRRYIAKPDTWYDAGTEAFLVEMYDQHPVHGFGAFRGTKSDKNPEVLYCENEVCGLDEFEIIEE